MSFNSGFSPDESTSPIPTFPERQLEQRQYQAEANLSSVYKKIWYAAGCLGCLFTLLLLVVVVGVGVYVYVNQDKPTPVDPSPADPTTPEVGPIDTGNAAALSSHNYLKLMSELHLDVADKIDNGELVGMAAVEKYMAPLSKRIFDDAWLPYDNEIKSLIEGGEKAWPSAGDRFRKLGEGFKPK